MDSDQLAAIKDRAWACAIEDARGEEVTCWLTVKQVNWLIDEIQRLRDLVGYIPLDEDSVGETS